ncbi:MAG: hypothetical protein WKF70_03090 [Chitinophagaceae bacterium]
MQNTEDEKPAASEKKETAPDSGITSASIENAHASGDGSIQRSDESIEGKELTEQKPDSLPY